MNGQLTSIDKFYLGLFPTLINLCWGVSGIRYSGIRSQEAPNASTTALGSTNLFQFIFWQSYLSFMFLYIRKPVRFVTRAIIFREKNISAEKKIQHNFNWYKWQNNIP